jgi:hypothetical protein
MRRLSGVGHSGRSMDLLFYNHGNRDAFEATSPAQKAI